MLIKLFAMKLKQYLTNITVSFFIGLTSNMYGTGRCTGKMTLKPYSITRFQGIEDLFLQLQRQRVRTLSRTKAYPQMEIDAKWRTCMRIFYQREDGTTFGEVLIDPETVYFELMDSYRSIFEDIFEEETQACAVLAFMRRKTHRYVNASKVRAIFVYGHKYFENTFSCVVREAVSGRFLQYYVSESNYNVNEAPGADYIEGRIIFTYNDEGKLAVNALAEEYSDMSVSNAYEVTRYYLTKHMSHSPERNPQDDPLCKLDTSRTLRLCNSVFMYEQLRQPCEIIPGDKCGKQQFSIPLLNPNPFSIFEEWMITCTVKRQNVLSEYHLSRSYNNNRVFVYVQRKGRLWLHHYTRKVSVVHDRATVYKGYDALLSNDPED